MHAPQSESAILRDLLEKTLNDKHKTQDKLNRLVGELDVECDLSRDSVWVDVYHCGMHVTHFKNRDEPIYCPVGKFAQELKNKYEQET